jgi:trk system potassium uptake protein TrkH
VEKRSRWREFRGVLRPTGAVITGLAVAQGACALVGGGLEWGSRSADGRHLWDIGALLVGALATGAIGMGAFVYGRRFSGTTLTRREAILAVVLIWALAAFFGGVPFALAAGMSPVDAYFEAMSGLTTTGATVITDIEARLSMPLLLWRSLIQWLGGMGIVVLFVAVFPSVGAGGKHMFKGEVPGATAEGLKPRIAETSFTLWKLYAALTVLEILLLVAFGMSPFESVCHALTTMSTGGFSTRDASIAGFASPGVEYVVSVFMLLGSLNFALYYGLLRHRSVRLFLRSTELRVFLVIVLLATLATSIGILHLHAGDLETAFRRALFQVGTFVSSTGYITDDYMSYPPAILGLMIFLQLMGGCSGSTAGGVKVERLVLLAKQSWSEFRRSFRPSIVHVVRMGRSAVPADVLSEVAVFFAVFIGVLIFGALFVSAIEGAALPTAFGAVLTCLANSGPAAFYSPADHFAGYSDLAKLFFTLVMLLGRLELFTIFALFVPDFWRR